MPKNLIRFERLMYLALAISVVSTGLGIIQEARADWARFVASARYLPLALAGISVIGLLIWFTARRRKNWARWCLTALFILNISFLLSNVVFPQSRSMFGASATTSNISIVEYVVQATAFYFAFTGDARQAFNSAQSVIAIEHSHASRTAGFVWLIALSIAAGAALIAFPLFIFVGGMTCDLKCNLLTPLSFILLPVALTIGAIIGWARRSRDSIVKLVAWSLAPPLVDISLFFVGLALTDILPI
jgi:hypothetical protein